MEKILKSNYKEIETKINECLKESKSLFIREGWIYCNKVTIAIVSGSEILLDMFLIVEEKEIEIGSMIADFDNEEYLYCEFDGEIATIEYEKE
jgi:hypothetical protein